jgi:hypothetical protein
LTPLSELGKLTPSKATHNQKEKVMFRVYTATHKSESAYRKIGQLEFVGSFLECQDFCRGYAGSLYTSALVIMDCRPNMDGDIVDVWEDFC